VVTLKERMLIFLNILHFEKMTMVICALNKFLVFKETAALHWWQRFKHENLALSSQLTKVKLSG